MATQPRGKSDDVQLAWEEFRSSPAFPALVGGLAGALGGAALVFLLGRLRGGKPVRAEAYDEEGHPLRIVYLPAPKPFTILGFTPGELFKLVMVGSSLVRQVQEWSRKGGRKRA